MLRCWVHIYLQCLCLLDGFFPWLLWSDLLGLSLWPFFWSQFCLIWVLLPLLFFSYLLGKFVSSPTLSFCVGLLSRGGSLIGSICVGHAFLAIQLFYVFWLKHLIHLHLRLLLIGTYSSPIFCTSVPLFLSLFLPFLKAVPLASLAELVWWRCILLDFFSLGSSLFGRLSWLRAVLGKVVLVAGLWFSLLGIFFAILFWLRVFPLRS